MKIWHPRLLIPNLTAGCIAGLLTLTYSVSYAALIFSGDLSVYLPLGISSALVGAVLLGSIVALSSSLPFIVAGPDGNAAAILALISTTLAAQLQPTQSAAAIAATIWVAIVLSTLLTGVCLWGLGRLRLGRFIRFIPYPVVGGFLAGVGLLLAQGAFKVMTNLPLTLGTLPSLLQQPVLALWVPGGLLAIALRLILGRYRNCWVLPSILVVATALVNGGLWIAGIDHTTAIAQGWLLQSFEGTHPLSPWRTLTWQSIQWSALLSQTGSFLTLFAVVAITILLCATSIEMATDEEMDLDRELCVAGLANLGAGLCGGMVGHLSVSRSLLNREAGATHRLSGVVAAGVCAAVALWGSQILSFLPRAILGGLLLYLGLSLLIEWVYDGYFRLSKLDYGLVLGILLIGARFGFLAGVGVGLVIACLVFVITYSSLQVIRNTLSGLTYPSRLNRTFHEQRILRRQGQNIQIFIIQGYLFFGTAYSLLSDMRQYLVQSPEDSLRFLILDFRLVSGLDSSALNSFIKMKKLARQTQVTLIFTGLSAAIAARLKRHPGIFDADDATCRVFADLDQGVEWCEARLIEQGTFRRRRFVPFAMQLEEFFRDPEQVRPFMKYLEKKRLPEGTYLFQQGEPAEAIYFIEAGQVTVFWQLDTGHKKTIFTSGPGTIIGEMGLYSQTPYAACCRADKPTSVYKLSRQALEAMLQQQPHLAAEFHQTVARILAERLGQAVAGVEKLMLLQSSGQETTSF